MFKLGYCGLVNTVDDKADSNDFVTSVGGKETINNYIDNLMYDMDYTVVQLNTGVYDNLYIDSGIDSGIDNGIDNENTIPSEWNETTILFAKFNGDLTAGTLDFDIENLNYMLICRKNITDGDNLVYEPINAIYKDEFNSTAESNIIIDRFVQNGKTYEYMAIPVLSDGTEANMLYAKYPTDDKEVKFYGHYIFDGESEWHCEFENECNWVRNKNVSLVNTLSGKYPYIVKNSQNSYDTITLSGTHFKISDCNWEENVIRDTAEYNREYDDFITNSKPKLIRDQNGRMWIADLNGSVEHTYDTVYYNIGTNHTFDEIGDANNINDLYKYGFTNYNPNTMVGNNIAQDVVNGATLRITLVDIENPTTVILNREISLLLNNVEIWQCRTNSQNQAIITNLDSGYYTIIVGIGVYAVKKYISINTSSPDIIDVEVGVK